MTEAKANGIFDPDYDHLPDNVLMKEYTYLLNYNMWECSDRDHLTVDWYKAFLRLIIERKHFLNWCVGRGYIEHSPALSIPKPLRETPRQRILSLAEMRKLYEASQYLSQGNGLFLRLLLLTGQREGVIAKLSQSELKNDQNIAQIAQQFSLLFHERPIKIYISEQLKIKKVSE